MQFKGHNLRRLKKRNGENRSEPGYPILVVNSVVVDSTPMFTVEQWQALSVKEVDCTCMRST